MSEALTQARPYAKAVFRLAQQQNDLAGWQDRLIASAGVMSNPKARAYLQQPSLTPEQRSAWLQQLLQGQLNDSAVRLLDVLAQNDRLPVLPEIATLYENMQREAQQISKVEVTSAHALAPEQVDRIRQKLVQKLGGDIELEQTIDASLLGGAIIRIGDEVLDGSVQGKLRALQRKLMN